MNKKTGIIIGVLIAAFLALVGVTLWQKAQIGNYSLSKVVDDADKINYDGYDLNEIIPADENTGGFVENIIGDPNAPVILYEYGDYQCTACAPMNPYINQLVEEYDGKLAVVMRTYIMSYHNHGVAAAAAANAAALQGYWKPFKDLLFSNQNEWYYSSNTKFQEQLEDYFETASEGKGDLEKFRSDMKSAAVAQKIAFDMGAGEKANVEWTPTFRFDGEVIDNRELSATEFLDKLRTLINAKLKEVESNKK